MWLRIAALVTLAGATLPAAEPLSLGLIVRQGSAVPDSVRKSFRADTERGLRQILSQSNLRVAWRTEGDVQPGEAYDRLIVLRFRGDCTTSMGQSMAGGGPLGSTLVTDGQILPFIDVDCGRVKSALARSGPWQHSMAPVTVFARALSRVALHEMYHVLAGRTQHDEDGLFKAEYSARDLLAPVAVHSGPQPVLALMPVER